MCGDKNLSEDSIDWRWMFGGQIGGGNVAVEFELDTILGTVIEIFGDCRGYYLKLRARRNFFILYSSIFVKCMKILSIKNGD